MGDFYDVDVVIYGWPAAAVVPRETHRGASFPDELSLDILISGVYDDDREPMVWRCLARIMAAAGWTEHAAIEYDRGILRVTCEHNYGLASINEDPDVLGALRDAGLAFYACDAGSQANLPAFAAWAPGWSAIRTGPATPDGDPLLDVDGWRALCGRAADGLLSSPSAHVQLADSVGDYFRTRDAVAEAARTEEPK